jgi:Uma2 family endonuclease
VSTPAIHGDGTTFVGVESGDPNDPGIIFASDLTVLRRGLARLPKVCIVCFGPGKELYIVQDDRGEGAPVYFAAEVCLKCATGRLEDIRRIMRGHILGDDFQEDLKTLALVAAPVKGTPS